SKTLERLQGAKTPEEAAHAFVGYERPMGYTDANPAGAHGYQSRIAFARTVYEGGDLSAVKTPAGSLWLAANRGRQLDKTAWEQYGRMEKDWRESRMRPSDIAVNDLIDAARTTNNFTLLDNLSAFLGKVEAVQGISQLPLPEQAARIAALKAQGEAGQLDPGAAPWIKDLEAKRETIEKGLGSDAPNTVAANFPERFKAVPALNLKDDNEFSAGLRLRGQMAAFGAQNWRTPALSALGKDDLQAVQAALDTPDVAQKSRVFSMLAANLPEDVLKATLGKLGEKGPSMMVSA